MLTLDDMCPVGPPCHVYATLPQDTAHDVFINVHTNKAHRKVYVLFDTAENYKKKIL